MEDVYCFLVDPRLTSGVVDWEHISEEEQRIWREEDGDFDLSEEESEEEVNQDVETFETHLTREVVIYKINKTNHDKNQMENKKQTLTSFWMESSF